MRIGLFSDLHLEYNTLDLSKEIPKIDVDVIVCAGDIGSPFSKDYKDLLRYLMNIAQVILIAGNHEYYNHSEFTKYHISMQDIEDQIQKVCDNIGVIFLQKSSIEIDEVTFVGCTLWADPSATLGESEWSNRYDAKYIADFVNVEDYISLHRDHKSWLKETLDIKSKNKVVVITHHVPSFELLELKFQGSNKNGYYLSSCDKMLSKADLWLCGHTHVPFDKVIVGTRCVCNPYGYPWEQRFHKIFKIITLKT
jgi:predicted phosphodiesterase